MLAGTYPKSAYLGLLDGKASANAGGLYEAFVTQELAAHDLPLRYFTSKKIGELDFVVERGDGAISAVEVKSGARYLTHAALANALGTKGYDVEGACVLAETNVRRDGRILYAPVFLAGMLFS